ncbi:MAG TPA: trehalose-phosphatase [Streptosporangiaceae bacterium]|jgi:trehalose 6-phosphate phosphatase
MTGPLPRPRTPEGRAGLAALLREPARALIALDFDGTLSPIVADPAAARAHPGAAAALRRLGAVTGTLAVITGRPAAVAVELGGFADVPGLIVLGHYGWERWHDGKLSSPPSPPGVTAARAELPAVLAGAGAPPGTWTEDKGNAVAVHTRRAADPQGALEALRGPLTALATRTGLTVEPGRLVIELRPRGTDKGIALKTLITERSPRSVMFCGDDLGDAPAFAVVRAQRASGVPGLTVCSGSAETAAELTAAADLVVDGPDGVIALLDGLADAITGSGP